MTGIVVLVFIFVIGALAVLFGADSRLPEDRRSL
jgi:Sec-independent protein translocase protein TatA